MTFGATNLTEHPTWWITDSTKTCDYQACPRMFFYQYILGWRANRPNIHLVFGQAWHLAMEYLLRHDYSEDSLEAAYLDFMICYRKSFGPVDDALVGNKTPAAAFSALQAYVKTYKHDSFEPLYHEIPGSFAIGENARLHFKIDAICRDDKGMFILDHKTCSRMGSRWINQWTQAFQVHAYLNAAFGLYGFNEVWGMVINGACFLKHTQTFERVPVRKSKDMMQAWFTGATRWYNQVMQDYERLAACSPDDTVLDAFHCVGKSCGNYSGCPYEDFCAIWANPLAHADKPPTGMTVNFWDPSAREKEQEKEGN